jgi:hypothetical protein
MNWRERGEREREKNAIYSGQLRLCQQPRAAHALRSDQKFWEVTMQLVQSSVELLKLFKLFLSVTFLF